MLSGVVRARRLTARGGDPRHGGSPIRRSIIILTIAVALPAPVAASTLTFSQAHNAFANNLTTSRATTAAACSNKTVTVFGKPTRLRFVVRGKVSCSAARSIMRAYFRAASPRSCPSHGTACLMSLSGGWNCLLALPSQPPPFVAECSRGRLPRPAATVTVYTATHAASTPGTAHPHPTSGPLLWTALGGKVECGVAVPPLKPPSTLLCYALPVPAANPREDGDPHFVYLRAAGRPFPVLISQKTWFGANNKAAPLASGRNWAIRASGITCTIAATTVRCQNRSQHGFTITANSYNAF